MRTSLSRMRALGVASAAALISAASAGAAQAAPLPTLNVSVAAGSIAVSGSESSGAVNVITTAAKGLKEPSPVLVLLKPGVSVAEFEAFLATNKLADPNSVGRYGSLVFDAEARAGASTEAQTVLAPGTYLALNAEGEKSGKWSRASFTVTTSAAPAVLPAPAAVEKTIDFAFRGPKTLHRGELVRFENEGYVVHMDIGFPVKSRKAGERLTRALAGGRNKAAEKLVAGPPVGFFGPLSSGAFQQETITAAPGWYVEVCFMETQDGRDHARLGMERLIRILR